ncbi:MAG: type II toxin-antitoxin system RelE/ParE family toxin [Alphaproteobacteria bacterium]|nr:type II toxin-antitoxin system RelE/ParE family toxin [Alphaproteobacteria bacterium]
MQAFLLDKDPRAAARVPDLLLDAAFSLRNSPRKGRPLRAGVRELIVPFGKGAYILRYSISEKNNLLLVARIWHSKEQR